jgi:hypothetical protein
MTVIRMVVGNFPHRFHSLLKHGAQQRFHPLGPERIARGEAVDRVHSRDSVGEVDRPDTLLETLFPSPALSLAHLFRLSGDL